MFQNRETLPRAVGPLEPGLIAHGISPVAAHGLGELAISSELVTEPYDSLLDQFNFDQGAVEQVRAVVAEARVDPKVYQANIALHILAGRGGEYQEFAQGVLKHQRDVAELAVMTAMRRDYTDTVALNAVALAGLTHDEEKGSGALAPVFMYRGLWSESMRQTGESHAVRAAERQGELGFSKLVQYLTERHHQDLRPNLTRHIVAGYGGKSITPPDGAEEEWAELAHIFSAADDVAANMRARGYKDGMTAQQAVLVRLPDNLVTPDNILHTFRSALPHYAAA